MGQIFPLTRERNLKQAVTGKVMVAGLVVFALAGTQTAMARPAPESFADLTEKVAPAVVNVSIVKSGGPSVRFEGPGGEELMPFGEDHPLRDFFERFLGPDSPELPGGPQEQRGLGSGFVIDPDGYVVTNRHVIAGADEITVTFNDGRSLAADLVGQDEKTDLALLKVEAEEALPSVAFGDSEAVRPGDWVIAVGNPFGLGGSVTAGIVSARGRDLPGGSIIDFLQIDAPINKGNSGGPTFDMDGEVIGVNTAIYSPNGGSVGIGFAIPSEVASKVVAELREHGKVDRGWLGVRIQAVTPEFAEGFRLDEAKGALISSVTPESPAAEAGLETGDVILSWDGKAVEDLKDLPRLVAFTEVGKTVEVEIWRDGERETLEVVTGRAPGARKLAALGGANDSDEVLLSGTGLTVATLTAESRARFGVDEDVEGVVILSVERDSLAAREGLRRGDIIRSLASEAVETAADAKREIEQIKAEGLEVVTLLVSRDGVETFFALRLRNA
ncbi:MAG: DegQ family serine endoprotease [Kiloniellales bacterium]|nr:DegQ family serine endoprotease [Kiloniellales bacterium]